MLAMARLQVEGEELLISATDLDVSVTATVPTERDTWRDLGSYLVGAKALHDIVGSLPEGNVTLARSQGGSALEVSSGEIEFRLVGAPDHDFPKIPDPDEVYFHAIGARSLRAMIDRTLFSVSNDETRFHLNGVLFESDGKKARMVSTDGHRLSKVERAWSGPTSKNVIIPKKGMQEIRRVIESSDNVSIGVKRPNIFVRGDTMTLVVKPLKAKFPPYQQVIPKQHTKEVVIDRVLLLAALKRAQLMSSETRGVKFSVAEDSLVITSDNPDIGEVREELSVEYKGEKAEVGANPRYLIEVVSRSPAEKIKLGLGSELDPITIQDNNDVFVIMPMRI
jgi:DNA polymerase-3 subunit beta